MSLDLIHSKNAMQDRRHFIGGSDARAIMGKDEKALLCLWKEKRGEIDQAKPPKPFRRDCPFSKTTCAGHIRG